MKKPTIALDLTPTNYKDLADFGNSIFAKMTGNLNFATPVPTLVALEAAVTSVEAALSAWGDVHNRGKHTDLVDLKEKALTLHHLLKAEGQYVEATAQLAAGNDYEEMANIIQSSGYHLKSEKHPQGKLEMPQNVHQFISRQLDPNQGEVRWKKPLNITSKNNVKAYKVYRSTTPDFNLAVVIATVPNTKFIDTNTTNAPVTYYYWFVAVGAAGDGVRSDVLKMTLLAVSS